VQAFAESITHRHRKSIVLLRPIENQVQYVSFAGDPDGGLRGWGGLWRVAALFQMDLEVIASLKGRVGQRFREEPIGNAGLFVVTQQLHQGGGRLRMGLDVSDQELCALQVLHHHISRVGKRRARCSNADDRAGKRAQVVPEDCDLSSVQVQQNERLLREWGKRFPPAG